MFSDIENTNYINENILKKNKIFLNYKKLEIFKDLTKSLELSLIDKSCFWTIILDFSNNLYQYLLYI